MIIMHFTISILLAVYISTFFVCIIGEINLHRHQLSQDYIKSKHAHPDGKKTRILYLADSKYYSHLNLAVQLANAMHSDGHLVDFVVTIYGNSDKLGAYPNNGIRVIKVLVKKDKKFEEKLFNTRAPPAFNTWTKEEFGPTEKALMKRIIFYNVFLYKTIIENPTVKRTGKQDKFRILPWLRAQNYEYGIAEFGLLTSAHPVFYELGIENVMATAAMPPMQPFLHFIGVKIPVKFPEYYTAQPGDGDGTSGVREYNSPRYKQNKKKLLEILKLFKRNYDEDCKSYFELIQSVALEKEAKETSKTSKKGKKVGKNVNQPLKIVPPLSALFNKVRYYFINDLEKASFPWFQVLIPKVKYIGGLEVEQTKVLEQTELQISKLYEGIKYSEKFHTEKPDHWKRFDLTNRIVIFNLGSLIDYDDIPEKAVTALFTAFSEHQDVEFLVKIDKSKVDLTISPNVHIVHMDQNIPQLKLLVSNKVHGFIHHCGRNSFNEAAFTGVPQLCIPFFADQRYNAAIGEYINASEKEGKAPDLWINHTNMAAEISGKLNNLLDEKVLKRARDIARLVCQGPSPLSTFKKAVNRLVNGDLSECGNVVIDRVNPLNQDKNFSVTPFVISKN